LIFQAMMRARSQRKQSGLPKAAEEAKIADRKETSRLEIYRARKKKERKQMADDLQVQIDAIAAKKADAAAKADIRIGPGYTTKKKVAFGTKKPIATPAERKAAAAERAESEALRIASANTKPATITPIPIVTAPKTEDE